MFTCCVLTWGDHAELLDRCLSSILQLRDFSLIAEFRIGLNEVSDATIARLSALLPFLSAIAPTTVFRCERGGRKYPVMRRMFHGEPNPISTPWILWLDDDSFFTDRGSEALRKMGDLLAAARIVGFRMRAKLRGQQPAWIRSRPWYAGLAVETGQWTPFIAGGLWGASTAFLRQHDYPFPEIKSQGGDYILGELCRQQGAYIADCRDGFRVNADANGVNHVSDRRGRHEDPVGGRYDPDRPTSLDHQQIQVLRFSYV